VKINIFKRINTGGLPLSPQEIRHALNGNPSAQMLKDLANSDEFKVATNRGVPSDRMADREYVVRFFAFLMTSPDEFSSQEFDSFLSDTMAAVNKLSDTEREDLKKRFLRAMRWAHAILGRIAFRKCFSLQPEERLRPVNKALFEAWSLNLDRLTEEELDQLLDRKDDLTQRFVRLMEDRKFEQAISQGTGDIQKVRLRFSAIERIIGECLA
jgi:hypothetical protein